MFTHQTIKWYGEFSGESDEQIFLHEAIMKVIKKNGFGRIDFVSEIRYIYVSFGLMIENFGMKWKKVLIILDFKFSK